MIRTIDIKAKQKEIEDQKEVVDKVFSEVCEFSRDLDKIRAGEIVDEIDDPDYMNELLIKKKQEQDREQIKLGSLERELTIMKGEAEPERVKPWTVKRNEIKLECFGVEV